MVTKLDIAKKATSFVVGMGTSKIISTIIRNNVLPVTVIDTVTVTAGSYVLGAMVADVSAAYTNAKIDAIAAWWQQNVIQK